MGVSIPEPIQERLNLDGGRPVHPGVTACEGYVEAIVATRDDATAFAHGSRHLAAMQRLCARLAADMNERSQRLFEVVVPELESAYRAAETAYAERAA